jgi:hypothetical protein
MSMTANIISLQDRRSAAAPMAASEPPLSTMIGETTLELWRRHDELLAIIEVLRQPDPAARTRFGPLMVSLETTVGQALVEVGLLIRQAERLNASLI